MLEVLDPEQNAHVPRPLPRRPVRPLARHVHHDGEHARHDPRAAARPHGGHRARGLHRGGEARDRQALPRAAPDRAQRPEEVLARDHRRGAARDHLATTRARPACATSSARSARSCRKIARAVAEGAAKRRGHDRAATGCASCSAAAVPLRRQAAHAAAGRRDRPRLDAGRRRRAVHRGDGVPRQGQAHDHRPARRRDAGVRPGGAVLRPRPPPRDRARPRRRLVRRARPPHPRPGRRDPEGRPERGHHDGDRAVVAASAGAASATTSR